jgi:hypothetical protein
MAKAKAKGKAPSKRKLCGQPPVIEQPHDPNIAPGRLSFIVSSNKKWVNGTEIKYMFTAGAEAQRNVVRQAFQKWKNLGIGISFREVKNAQESMVRIGFTQGDGAWSYVGRDVLTIPKTENTMNFGWSLTAGSYGMTTALHEIGHTIGFQHEHQSPFAGIEWDVNAVYKEFMGPPNNWSKTTIDNNIIKKLSPNQVKGSNWDAKSIMEYEFGPGLILKPDAYKNGIFPPGTLSAMDIQGVKSFYPPLKSAKVVKLKLLQSAIIKAVSGGQADFEFKAPNTQKYTFQTFGKMDTVMVLYEKGKKENFYLSGDDDSGFDKNTSIELPLVSGREYLVRVRVMYTETNSQSGIVVF